MIDPVVIDFATRGLPDVMRAFSSIENRMERAERAGTTVAGRESAARLRTTRREVDDRERAYARLQREIERDERRATQVREREAAKAAQAVERATKKLANAEIHEAERVAREVEKLEEWKTRVRTRAAEKAIKLQQQMGHAGMQGLGRGISGGLRLAGAAAGSLMIGGSFAVADAVRKQLSAEKQASMLVNTVTTGAAPPPGANVASILAQASVVSAQTGLDKSSLIGGSLEYARKARGGDFSGAMANMSFFAKMAQVTGADVNEIAASAGTLQSQNQALAKDPQQMQQMLLDVYAQGKAGSMSMVDVAKQIGTLASTRSAYAGNAATNQRKLLALGQLAAPEGSVEEAGTFIKDLTSEAGMHRKSTRGKRGLESMGVKFDKFGRMDSPEQMIGKVFEATGGDITKIEEIFGKRGTALFRALQPEFVAAGGGAKGIEAVNAKMASVTAATMTPEQLEAQHAQTMSTPAMRLQAAFEKIEDSLGQKLEPALSKLADKAPKLAETFGSIADAGIELLSWLMDNTWKGLGAIVAGKIATEIATAQLGVLLNKEISGAVSGKISGGIGLVSAAISAGVVTMMVIDQVAAQDVRNQQRDVLTDVNAVNNAATIARRAAQGDKTVTAKDIAGIENDMAAASKKMAELTKGPSFGTAMLGGLASLMGGDALKLISGGAAGGGQADVLKADAERRQLEFKSVSDTMAKLVQAAGSASAALNAMAGNAAQVKSSAPAGPIGNGAR